MSLSVARLHVDRQGEGGLREGIPTWDLVWVLVKTGSQGPWGAAWLRQCFGQFLLL